MKKIGLHIIGGTSLPLGQKPPVIKLVNVSVEYVKEVRAKVGPDPLIIIRWIEDQSMLSRGARTLVNSHLTQMKAMAAGDPNIAFEGLNEVPDSECGSYSSFELERLQMLHSVGLRAVVGNWSVGTPDFPIWSFYQKVLDAMGPRDLVGLHEYWYDHNDINNRWHCARWTKVPQLAGKKLVVTEAGRDRVEAGKDSSGNTIYKGDTGWKKTATAQEFLSDLRGYDTLLCTFPDVLGFVVFQTGSTNKEWKDYEVSSIWTQVVSEYQNGGTTPPPVTPPPSPTLGTQANPIIEPPIQIDGRCMTPDQFDGYVRTMTWTSWKPSQIFLHHTYIPTVADWAGRTTVMGMKNYYEHQLWKDNKGLWHRGWSSGPHLFIAPDGIWIFSTIVKPGTHAGDPYNSRSIGIEMVGDYDLALPKGPILGSTVRALASLFRSLGLDPSTIMFHRDVSTKTCPGRAVTKQWVIELIKTELGESALEAFIGTEAQKTVVPLDPSSAFEKFAVEKLWLPSSYGFEVDYKGKKYSVQVYRAIERRDMQYIVYCLTGDWGHIRWFGRKN